MGFESATDASWRRCDQCEQRLRNRIERMAQKAVPIHEVSGHAAYSHVLNALNIGDRPFSPFSSIAGAKGCENGAFIHEGVVEDWRTGKRSAGESSVRQSET